MNSGCAMWEYSLNAELGLKTLSLRYHHLILRFRLVDRSAARYVMPARYFVFLGC